MTQRRRRYRDEDDHPQPSPSFNWGQIVNLGGIPLITAVFLLVGQWFVMGESTRRSAEDIKAEKVEREKMRESFMGTQTQLVSVLGKLDTRMSVSEKSQETMARQLEKVSDFLQTNTPRKVPVR